MEDYKNRFMGLDLSENFPHNKLVLAKATQKVVYTDYDKLDKILKKCEVELVNIKDTVSKLHEKIK